MAVLNSPRILLVSLLVCGVAQASESSRQPQQESSTSTLEGAYWFTVGKLSEDEADFEAAREALERAAESRSEDPYGWLELARLHESLSHMGRTPQEQGEHLEVAAGYAERARRLAEEDSDIVRATAQIYYQWSQFNPEALEIAEDALRTLRDRGHADAQTLAQLGEIYLRSGRASEAADILTDALDLMPHRMVRSMRMEALMASGRLAEAAGDLEAMVREEPWQLELRARWASALSEGGDHVGAAAALRDAPGDQAIRPDVQRMLARELYLARRPDEAAEVLDRFTGEVDPAFQRLRIAIYDAQLRYDEALEVLRPLVLEAPPGSAKVEDVVLMTRLLERTGDLQGALDLLGRESESREAEHGLQLRIARVTVLSRMGRTDAALVVLEDELLRAGPEWAPPVINTLVDILRDEGRTVEALERLEAEAAKLEAANPDAALRLRLRGLELLAQDERWQELSDAAKALGPIEDVDLANLRRVLEARALAGVGQIEEAMGLLDGEAVEDLGARAELLLQVDRFEEAQEELSLLENREGGALLAARIYQNAEYYAEALPLLKMLLEKDPDSQRLLFLLGASQERLGEYEAAEETFRRLLELRPDHVPTMNYLGYMWADQGENLEEAHELLRRAVGSDPDNGAYVDSLGWVLFRMGRLEEARPHLEWAARLVPDDAALLLHLGDLYEGLEDLDAAREAWGRAAEMGGEDGEKAKRRLEELGD